MKSKKMYLLKITHENGATFEIIGNTDRSKNQIVIYFCGSDSGISYNRIGNAARYLEKIARGWYSAGCLVSKTYGTPDDIILYGCSAWNDALFKYDYCGAAFPKLTKSGKILDEQGGALGWL